MSQSPQTQFHIAPQYQPALRQLGLDAQTIFTHPQIKPWRSIPERENCLLEATLENGQSLRWHIKRHYPTRRSLTPAEIEFHGIEALRSHNIPTVPLVGWGTLSDGRSFLITEDLTDYLPADQLLQQNIPFDQLRDPIADLAAKLHSAGLHHRDLYLCHFFAKITPASLDLRLIDPGRVKCLPPWPFRNRWIVKDLAQLLYSASQIQIPDSQQQSLFTRYATQRKLSSSTSLQCSIARKIRRIARHDAHLRQKQPTRNISIPLTPDP